MLALLVSLHYFIAVLGRGTNDSRVLWSGYEQLSSQGSKPSYCEKYTETVRPIDASNNTYKLWPGLMFPSDMEEGKVLYGFYEAMDIIWRNQNPPDCSKAKFIIAGNWFEGFGSEVHVHGIALAIAVHLGKVLLIEPMDPRSWRIQHNPACSSQNSWTLECYYEPWSRCTFEDAVKSMSGSSSKLSSDQISSEGQWSNQEDQALFKLVSELGAIGHWSEIARRLDSHKSDVQCFYRWKSTHFRRWEHEVMNRGTEAQRKVWHTSFYVNPEVADVLSPFGVFALPRLHGIVTTADGQAKIDEHRYRDKVAVVMTMYDLIAVDRTFIPHVFHELLHCSPMDPAVYYFWWRSMSAAFILRPNAATLKTLEELASPVVQGSRGYCVATYVRHGDKHREMRLVPFARYKDAAEVIWNDHMLEIAGSDQGRMNHSQLNKILYIGSEDSGVIDEAVSWGQTHGIQVSYAKIAKEIIQAQNRNHHHLEYLSFLMNLAETVRCQIAICTYMSNFCRVVDEIRGTVGGKANRYYADVNYEICPEDQRACVRKDALLRPPLKDSALKKSPGLWR